MHAVAESGIAAHWLYKANGQGRPTRAQRLGTMWLQSLLDIQDETRDAAEFLEHVKIDLFPDAVYVFTPKSKILALPRGATPVDFAYAIHSDVGDHTVAAQVNGEPVALRTELRNGDVVEVVTAPGARAQPGLAELRAHRPRALQDPPYLKTMEQDESRALGEKLLAQALRAEGLELPPTATTSTTAARCGSSCSRWSGNRTRGELLTDIGLGKQDRHASSPSAWRSMMARTRRPPRCRHADAAAATPATTRRPRKAWSCSTAAKAPRCNSPPAAGRSRATTSSATWAAAKAWWCTPATATWPSACERDSERWMRVEWADEPTRAFETAIMVLVRNGKGVLAQVAARRQRGQADITHVDMGEDRAGEATELRLLISVRDRLHLADVLRTLAALARRCCASGASSPER